MKVALFGKRFSHEFREYFEQIIDFLTNAKCDISIYKPFATFLNSEMALNINTTTFSTTEELVDSSFILSIGGDGTFLEAITVVRNLNIPIAAINSGRLGFLADISKDDIAIALEKLLSNNYNTHQLDLLEVTTNNQSLGSFNYALNELAITKRDNASMITVHAWLNNEFLNAYWADGLIIATATGSTAYSLSVGGPIVHPSSQNLVISPIAPHNLTVRPLVIPNHFEIKLKVNARGGKFLASLDSRSVALEEGTEITIRKAPFTITVAQVANQSFCNTLREKLMWGADRRN